MRKVTIATNDGKKRRIKQTTKKIVVNGVRRSLWIDDFRENVHPYFGWIRLNSAFQYVYILDDFVAGTSKWTLGNEVANVTW